MFSYRYDSASELYIPKCVAIAIENSYYLQISVSVYLFLRVAFVDPVSPFSPLGSSH